MANDTKVSIYHRTSAYARINEEGNIQVRGTAYKDYDGNHFSPEGARNLAQYILELADDAEHPALDEMKADLQEAYQEAWGVEMFGPSANILAKALIKNGYRKA